MLGPRYNLSINNNTGVAFSAVITMVRWKLASDGSITFDTEQTIFNMSGTLTTGASTWFHATGGPFTNTSDKWMGALFVAQLTPGGSATGPVRMVIRRATSASAIEDPERAENIFVADFASSSAARTISAELPF